MLTRTKKFVFRMGKYVWLSRNMAMTKVETASSVVLRVYDIQPCKQNAPKTSRHGCETLIDSEVELESKTREIPNMDESVCACHR